MSTPGKIGLVSLGCPKALVDSERIVSQLRAEGYEISASYDDADLVIVNTCGFMDSAIEESLEAIGEAIEENGKVIVTGCLGAKGNIVAETHPKVLAITGPHDAESVLNHVHNHLPKLHDPYLDLIPPAGIKLTPDHYAYLKISEGCNHKCTFCIIPSLRGGLVSRPSNDVLKEAENLVESGVNELLVISQDTSAYGLDLKYKTTFWNGRPVKTRMTELCNALGSLGAWVRLHYVYPYPHVDEVIPLMAEGKILPYLDIPFQHASPKILKAMRRPGNIDNTLDRIKKWRQICPEITLRSTFIVGFPGETDSDFEMLLDFLEKAELDRVGAFMYSAVDGAEANQIGHQIDEDTKFARHQQLMLLQSEISERRLAKKVGKTIEVIIDDINEEEGIVGRSKGDAPEIDGLVYIENPKNLDLQAGNIISIKVTDNDEYDLWGDAQSIVKA